MRHKVICSDCGKKGIVEIDENGKFDSEWIYFGKIDVNFCKTNKYFYRLPKGASVGDFEKHVKVKNSCYDPNVKRKYVEIWECPECFTSDKRHKTKDQS